MRFALTPGGLQDPDNKQAATGRLLNCYRDRVSSGEKTAFIYRSTLGTEAFASVSELFARDMQEIGGTLYAVIGSKLYSIDASGTTTELGTVSNAAGSQVFGDGTNVCVVSGGNYYLWNGATLSQPTGGAFSSFSGGTFLRNYVFLAEQGGRRFLWSDIADASTLPALNFSTADGADDNIVLLMAVNGRLLIMKEKTIETWYITGQSGANAIKPASAAVMEVGLKGARLATKVRGGVFFVGDDNKAHISSGSGVEPVTGQSPAVEAALEGDTATDVFYWEDRGKMFCAINFSDRPAWVYDFSNGQWFERSYGTEHGPWSVTTSANAYGNWYVANNLGAVQKLTRNNADVGSALRRTIVSQPLFNDGNSFRIPHFELTGRVGKSDLGRDAEVMLRVSPNGHTWGPEMSRSMGDAGEYDQTMEWRNLGWFDKQAVFEVSTTDPVDIPINGTALVRAA